MSLNGWKIKKAVPEVVSETLLTRAVGLSVIPNFDFNKYGKFDIQ